MGGHFYVVQICTRRWRVIRNVCELAKTARKHQRKRKIIIHAGRQDEVCSVGLMNKDGRAETSQRVGEVGTLQGAHSDFCGLSVDLNQYWKRKIYTALVFLSPCDRIYK